MLPYIHVHDAGLAEVLPYVGQWAGQYLPGADSATLASRALHCYEVPGDGAVLAFREGRFPEGFFYFLVNYLAYPPGAGRRYEVSAYLRTATDAPLGGKLTRVYIPDWDERRDGVYLEAEDRTRGFFSFADYGLYPLHRHDWFVPPITLPATPAKGVTFAELIDRHDPGAQEEYARHRRLNRRRERLSALLFGLFLAYLSWPKIRAFF